MKKIFRSLRVPRRNVGDSEGKGLGKPKNVKKQWLSRPQINILLIVICKSLANLYDS